MRTFSVTVTRGDRVTMRLPLCASVMALQEVVVSSASEAASATITNNQHDGVDEGDIVKRHGDHLVVLRRGRLFSVDVSAGRLRPVSAINAYGPGIDASGDWYDEMLIAGDRIVVVGYSYRRGGTELGLFHIDRDGKISYEATYDLRSNDYYSSRNYASRLVGTHLIFYSPLAFYGDSAHPLNALPALRRWRSESDTGGFHPTATARRVYRFAGADSAKIAQALHTVTMCDLAAIEVACESTVVIGPSSRSFYVSPDAVYIAASAPAWCRPDCRASDADASTIIRMPLDGAQPSAILTRGTPIDQFSFLEQDGVLNVLLQANRWGDAMWGPEIGSGGLALLQLPLTRFVDGTREALPGAYRPLPSPTRGTDLHDRFVGNYLLYGAGNSWGRPRAAGSFVVVVPTDGGEITRVALQSPVDRIEAMGRRAVVVGGDTTAIHFTAIRLGDRPFKDDEYSISGLSQGELRSHAFFYKQDGRDSDHGMLGLPVRGRGEPGWKHLIDESAAVVFLRNDDGDFRSLGRLEARPTSESTHDSCVASCVDWYGNSRPLFFDGRLFALLGSEIVEGRLEDERIHEIRRAAILP